MGLQQEHVLILDPIIIIISIALHQATLIFSKSWQSSPILSPCHYISPLKFIFYTKTGVIFLKPSYDHIVV